METSAKYISLGPAGYIKRVSNTVRVHGGFVHKVAPQQVLVMEQEIKALLEKGAIEYVPHSNRETGFYSRYFIVPEKDGGKANQYRILPFGLALSPRTFTKCVDAAMVLLRLQGIRIMNYIYNWLILAQSHQLAVWHQDVVGTQRRCRRACHRHV